MAVYVPSRGDVAWINFDPQAGHEQGGRRPAIVLSPRGYNKPTGLALLCPVTSRSKNYPFEVPLPADARGAGVVSVDQLRNLAWHSRQASFVGVLMRKRWLKSWKHYGRWSRWTMSRSLSLPMSAAAILKMRSTSA